MTADRGYIVHPVERSRGGKTSLNFFGRLENGETFAIVETRRPPCFHIREEEVERARSVMGREAARAEQRASQRLTMDGARTVLLETATSAEARRLRDALHHEGVRTYEADVKACAQVLMDLRIHGTVEIRGQWRPGRRVGRVYENPEMSPASFKPRLSVLSIDIETDARARRIYAVAIAFRGPHAGTDFKETASEEVLFNAAGTAAGAGESLSSAVPGARSFPGEKEMLLELRQRIVELDPDIITGWNNVDFDFRVIAGRFEALGIPFDIGRSDTPARFLDRGGTGEGGVRWKKSVAIVEGRQVIDAMWLTRLSGLTMEDYRLETVAQTLLGKGKRIEYLPGETATAAIERLYRTEPASLADYCLEDARLVLQILEKEGLMELAVAKSLLIGTPLDQTWASVASFEFLYIEHMHARGRIAPTLGIDQDPLDRAPGGGIITPRAGLFDGVLVFDFKSLYPSLMRTFNIDPLTHVRNKTAGRGVEAEAGALPCITAPNGERFSREPGILPEILNRFFESREQAKKEGNRAATYAYKIVMNSFYGVLGTDGCRFASSALSGAITTFGQHILFWARDLVKSMGYEVIYGDTDSLFVLSGLARGTEAGVFDAAGAELCMNVNKALTAYVREAFGVESRLELEFEGCYLRFFLPPMRTTSADADADEPAGRAKGYSGLRADASADGTRKETIDFVGMEAVRHDWTELAQELQRGLLDWVFHDAAAADIEERIRTLIKELRSGKKDAKLAYRKLLRKPVEAYTKSSPPHARAAAMLPPEERSGLIRYVWTKEGPQPESRMSAPLDYGHYVDKQMRPIVEAVAPYAGLNVNGIFAAGGQMELF